MLFTPDTELALAFIAALADTVPSASASGTDELDDPAAFAALFTDWQYSGRRDNDAHEVAAVKEARTRLTEIWHLDRDGVVDAVNTILADADAVPQLVKHEGMDWHIHATSPEAPLAQRVLVEAAMALVDVVRADAIDRLRDCEAEDCEGIFVDLSKNASKRYCSARCGNRMNVRAYRERRA